MTECSDLLKKWEYKWVVADDPAFPRISLNEQMKDYGELGWEAYSITQDENGYIAWLKRPKQ